MVGSGEDVAIVGAGAIGGLMAAELCVAGRNVTLCGRSRIPRLRVDGPSGTRSFTVGPAGELSMATTPDEVGPARWVVVTLKAQDSPMAGPWLARLAGAGTTVVVLQNGVEHRQRLEPHAHGAPVLPALTNTAVERKERGHLVHWAGDLITVPDQPGAAGFAALLDGAELRVDIDADFTTAAWRKLLSNIAANPLTALTDRRMDVFADSRIRELALRLLDEAAAVARMDGARLAADEPARILAAIDRYPPDGGSSMLYDRRGGRPLEYDALTGAVLRAAGRHDMPVPLNQAVFALLAALDGSGRT